LLVDPSAVCVYESCAALLAALSLPNCKYITPPAFVRPVCMIFSGTRPLVVELLLMINEFVVVIAPEALRALQRVATPETFNALLSVVTPEIFKALLNVVMPLTTTGLLNVDVPLNTVIPLLNKVAPETFRVLLSVVAPEIFKVLLSVVVPLTITLLLNVVAPFMTRTPLLKVVAPEILAVPTTCNVDDGLVIPIPIFEVITRVFVIPLMLLLVHTEVLLPNTPALEAKLAVV